MIEVVRPHDLIRLYAWVREPCACGEVIESPTRLRTDVYLAVRRHTRGVSHQMWRARGGLNGS